MGHLHHEDQLNAASGSRDLVYAFVLEAFDSCCIGQTLTLVLHGM